MKIKAALIGCGRISSKHIDGFIDNYKEIELVALCDKIREKAELTAKNYNEKFPESDIKIYTDYKQLLKEIKPDMINIATESGVHAKIAIDCLNNKAHVIVEKPMALSTKDADDMIEAADKNNRKLGVCYQNRFNEPVRKLKEAIDKNRFGKILHSQIQVYWNRNENYYKQAIWRGTWENDGGTLMNQCSHGIDLLQWLGGNFVKRVYGVTRRFQRNIEAEDYGTAILEFDDGAVGVIEGTANVYPKNLSERLHIFGKTGTAVIGGLAVNKIETWDFQDEEPLELSENNKEPKNVYGFGHTPLFKNFIDAVKSGREPLVNGKEGKKSLDIILAVYRSMKERRHIDLPTCFSTENMKKFFN